MRKGLTFLFIISLACAVILVLVKPFSEKKHSEVIEKVVKKEGKVIARYKIAELPITEPKQKKELDVLEGKVVFIPNNPDDINSKMMVAIQKGKETIVLTNLDYVRTLGYIYYDRTVHLKGRWQKDAVIFGRKYRSFRIEDITLVR
ncbi:MAG: hypothetical protein NT145_03140 [Elusimicrobia bacterium]|nr:hypothetical protein [Elusimicrobiota bacterium]